MAGLRPSPRCAPHRGQGTVGSLRVESHARSTSDYVLDELITLLFRRESYDEAVRFLDGLLADSARGTLQIQRLTTERFQAALELRKRFRDKPDISFTDLTTMAVMRELQIIAVVTEDNHFLHVGMGFQRLPE